VTANRHRQQPPRGRSEIGVAASRRTHSHALEAALLLAFMVLAFAALRDAHAGTYKWTDEKGVVHYADKLPAEAVGRERVQLDSQGMEVKRVEAVPTRDQLREKYRDAEAQRQAQRDKESAERRDNALVATYSKEQDIDFARNRSLTTVDGQLQSARVYAAQLTKRQQELLEKKIAAGNKGVAPAMERELESIDRELAKTNELIADRRKEMEAIAARYDADKRRWNELVAIAKAEAAREKANSIPGQAMGGPVSVMPVGATPR